MKHVLSFLISAMLAVSAMAQGMPRLPEVQAGAVTPIQCSMMTDVLYMAITGQRMPMPNSWQPLMQRAAEFWQRSSNADPYFHSTTFLLECLRTDGTVDRMYDPAQLVDPNQPRRGKPL